jgi:hypothetical protein
MPYKVKGKCVYKKDGGAKVGCTKGSVEKYLGALHANANESEDKSLNEIRLFVRKTLLESVSKIKSNEYNKPYRFYMLCDKLCNIEGVEVKNKMIADASPISRKTFEKNCAYASELFESESQMADDPSHGFYKSNVKGVPCLYMQYAGFEFIFLKDYEGGKEYWLDELNESQELREDYPSHFDMEHFKSLKTFAQRIQYCDANLKRIGGGSSRIVFKIDDQKVLKLAKNKKGIVQNDTEIDRGNDTYYSSILAQVFDSDDDGLWVEMELATPINKYEFYRLTNFDLKDVGNYLINFQSETNGRGIVVHQQKPLVDRLVNDEFIQLLRDFVAGTDALAGDLGVATSYGLVKRNGHQELVIIDFGLTDRDYEKLYRESIEKKETGSNLNDNFFKWFAGSKIADASGNPIPVHHGTSKKFSKFNIKKGSQPIIWFTSNKSAIEAGEVGAAGKGHIMDLYVSIKNPAGWDEYEKYGLGQLKERGYDGVILPESDGTFTGFVFEPTQLKSVKNKGEWNPNDKNIYKEVTELDEAHHREEEWKKEIAQVAKQLKVELTNFIGAGVWGIAYEIPGNKVIKITEDDREVENAKHLVGKKNKFMADIYKVYSIGRKKEQESSPFRFSAGKKIIVMEKLMPLESVRPMLGKVIDFSDAFDEYSSEESSWSEMLENGWDEDFDNYLRKQNKGLEDVYSDLLAIYEEAASKGIYLTDMHQENFGIKNGHLAIFDIT